MKKSKKIIGYISPIQIGKNPVGTIYVRRHYTTSYLPTIGNDIYNVTYPEVSKEIVEKWEPFYEETNEEK